MGRVSLLTNHAEALLCVATTPGVRVREIADCIGVTERAAQRIVRELVADGYLTSHRVGRRNFYEIHLHLPVVQADGEGVTVGQLLSALLA